MKKVLFLLVSLYAISCHSEDLMNGDLIFSVSDSSAFSRAISLATSVDSLTSFDHVGIINLDNLGNISVIEASPGYGVREVSLEEFLSNRVASNGKPAVLVKRVVSNYDAAGAVIAAKNHIGEEYDWWYLPDNGKMYCSELVYECCRDSNGNPIFSTVPMNFRDSEGNLPEFWIKLFEELGEDVPEGLPGTNPTQIANDCHLREVMRFF